MIKHSVSEFFKQSNASIVITILFFILCFGGLRVNASPDIYTIEKYHMDISVGENNVLHIEEEITANFRIPRRGIYREIPLMNKIERLDGTVAVTRPLVRDLRVSEEHKVSTRFSSGTPYMSVRIGNPDITHTGERQYTISYNYDLGEDTGQGYDEFYFNLIGSEWDTTINNISFSIEMPKEFDENNLGFSVGKIGSTDSEGIVFSVLGNTITGSYNKTLRPGNALTVRLELPEGYFVGARESSGLETLWIFILLPALITLIVFLIWVKYGKDDEIIDTVEFYPPDGLNSAEVGLLYNGNSSSNEVVSLLIYLASKGYLKIVEFEQKALFSGKETFKIQKVKEYDGSNDIERIFFDNLFAGGKNEVYEDDLKYKFYITIEKIKKLLNCRENKKKIFEKTSLWAQKISFILIIISLFITGYMLLLGENIALLAMVVPFAISITLIINRVVVLFKERNNKVKNILILIGVIWIGLFFIGGGPLVLGIFRAYLLGEPYPMVFFIGILFALVTCIFLNMMPKRTSYGNEVLGKILGFQNFLINVEKEKLEALIYEDPEYFYNVLPFTYVLNVSNKWIKMFESITIQPPNWYSSDKAFDRATFSKFMTTSLVGLSRSMSTSPNNSFSSSGGGSSGGGSGGGGGSSW